VEGDRGGDTPGNLAFEDNPLGSAVRFEPANRSPHVRRGQGREFRRAVGDSLGEFLAGLAELPGQADSTAAR